MQLTGETSSAKFQIKKYQPGCITVNDKDYSQTILIMPDFMGAFNCKNYLQAYEQKPEVILLGTGGNLNIPDELIGNSMGIEVMTTAAACRTYTILANDKRNVMAVLQP